MNTNKAVKLAFPKLKPQTQQIIADWYDNEDAGDDFDDGGDWDAGDDFDDGGDWEADDDWDDE